MTQIGLVPLAMAFVAGMSVFAGLYHILVAVRQRGSGVHLTFGAMCLLAAVWASFGLIKYTATDPAVYAEAAAVRVSIGQGIGTLFIWYVAFWSGVRPRVYLWGMTAFMAVLLVLNEASEFGIYFSGMPELDFPALAWGETVTVSAGPRAWGWTVVPLSMLATFAFGLVAAWPLWRGGRTRDAWALALATAFFFAASLNTYQLFFGTFPPGELGFLGFIVVMSLTMADDVVEAARVKDALERSELRFRTLVETSPEAVLLIDVGTGRVVEANDQALTLYGTDQAGLGDLIPAVAAPQELEKGMASAAVFRRWMLEADRGGLPEFRWQVRRPDGSVVPCRAQLARLPGEDPVLVRLNLVDLQLWEAAEQRQAVLEEQLFQSQRLESVGRLTGGVAHDFNNFLTVMRGNLELLSEGGFSEEERELLIQQALEAAERSAELTQRMLAFSRRQPLAPRLVEVGSLIAGISRLLNRTLRDDITLELDLPEDLWPVRVDPTQLESSVVNLAVNAKDAMPDGGSLVISAQNVTRLDSGMGEAVADGPYVALTVADTGSGMGAQVKERAFDPFFTTKVVGEGTGLGLSMVYGFVSQSGGTVRIDSELGVGTSVHLFVPAEPATS